MSLCCWRLGQGHTWGISAPPRLFCLLPPIFPWLPLTSFLTILNAVLLPPPLLRPSLGPLILQGMPSVPTMVITTQGPSLCRPSGPPCPALSTLPGSAGLSQLLRGARLLSPQDLCTSWSLCLDCTFPRWLHDLTLPSFRSSPPQLPCSDHSFLYSLCVLSRVPSRTLIIILLIGVCHSPQRTRTPREQGCVSCPPTDLKNQRVSGM